MSTRHFRTAFTVVIALFLTIAVFTGPAAASDGRVLDGITVETEDGTELTVDGSDVLDGFVSVECTEGGSGSYCDKEAKLEIGPAAVHYEGFNQYDPDGPTGSYGDTLVVTLDGEIVATVEVSDANSPAATLIGYLGGLFFGLFG